jgi:signal transduction histidine kinase
VYVLLLAAWAGIAGWQGVEHRRVTQAARTALINRARDITTTLGLVLRSQRRWGGIVSQERIESALNELVRTDELMSVFLLNVAGEIVASAGAPASAETQGAVHTGERWGANSVTLVNLVDLGTNVVQDGGGSRPIIVVPRRDLPGGTNTERRAGIRIERPPSTPPPRDPSASPAAPSDDSAAASSSAAVREPPGGALFGRPPRMSEEEYQGLIRRKGLHGFVVVMSTASVRAACRQDLWLRTIIAAFAAATVGAFALAWRHVEKSSELQVRLVRASELTKHLKEMNIAAAGLAHETRNPLNIIRGLAQMISKQPSTSPEIQRQSRAITDEVDRVTAQLNAFIHYSKPVEVRRAPVRLAHVAAEVARALECDLEDKAIRLTLGKDDLTVEADEQLLRQALFNLMLNATQAVDRSGHIELVTGTTSDTEAFIEVRDDGPGVAPEHQQEIFKPYFTTHQKGTGLGLAVVQQIVLAHGWDVQCLANLPHGAVFRLGHLRRVPPA